MIQHTIGETTAHGEQSHIYPSEQKPDTEQRSNVLRQILEAYDLAVRLAKMDSPYLAQSLAGLGLVLPLSVYRRLSEKRYLRKLSDWWLNQVNRLQVNEKKTNFVQEIKDRKLNGIAGEFVTSVETNLSPDQAFEMVRKLLFDLFLSRAQAKKLYGRNAFVELPSTLRPFLELRTREGLQRTMLNNRGENLTSHLSNFVEKWLNEDPQDWSHFDANPQLDRGRKGILRIQDVDYRQPGSAHLAVAFVSSEETGAALDQMLLNASSLPELSTNGANALITLVFVIDDNTGRVSRVMAKFFHPFTDGAPGKSEIEAAVKSAQAKKPNRWLEEMMTQHIKPMELDQMAASPEAVTIPTAVLEAEPVYELADDFNGQKKKLENWLKERTRPSIIKKIRRRFQGSQAATESESDQNTINPEKRPAPTKLDLPAYEIVSLAILLTLGRRSLHQLIAVPETDTIAPNVLKLPAEVLSAIQNGWQGLSETKKQRLKQKTLEALALSKADRILIKKGGGVLPVLAVAAGRTRRVVQLLGSIANRPVTSLTDQQVLVSPLMPNRLADIPRPSQGGGVNRFTTAFSEIYNQSVWGALARRNERDEAEIVITARTNQSKLPDDLEAALQANLEKIDRFLREVVMRG